MNEHRPELADIFRTHQQDFLARWNHVLSRQQKRALRDIRDCRTAVLGGHLHECDRCGHRVISYNSCRNRHCPKCQATARDRWLAERQAELLPVPYFHVVFTLPQQIGRLALQNKRPIYGLLFRAAAETLLEHRRDPQTPRRRDRLPRRSSHLGTEPAAEPSLMMPVIIICLILNEQLRLIFHTSPSQNELACSAELLDDAPHRFCAQIRATNFPWSTRGRLFPLQKARFHESLDGTMTNTTQPSRFIQADSVRISEARVSGRQSNGFCAPLPRGSDSSGFLCLWNNPGGSAPTQSGRRRDGPPSGESPPAPPSESTSQSPSGDDPSPVAYARRLSSGS